MKRRAEKEAFRTEKEAVREASRMEDKIRDLLPRLEERYFSYDENGFYTDSLIHPPITSKQV
ncbi:MAG TPA: hypothetical protein VIG74_06495, partial [Alphaproteobacteria bacterium]